MQTRQIEALILTDIITELDWMQETEPMALEVIVAIESQAPHEYWELDEGEFVTLHLTDDHWAIVGQTGVEEVAS